MNFKTISNVNCPAAHRENYSNHITNIGRFLLQRRAKLTVAGFYSRIRKEAEAFAIDIANNPALTSIEITVDQIDRDIWNAIHALQK